MRYFPETIATEIAEDLDGVAYPARNIDGEVVGLRFDCADLTARGEFLELLADSYCDANAAPLAIVLSDLRRAAALDHHGLTINGLELV